MLVAPSILSGDFSRLGYECQRLLSAGADWIHVDIMDGHFVPNLTIGPPVVAAIRNSISKKEFLDCHLMVSNPEFWVKPIAEAGGSLFTFHLEAVVDTEAAMEIVKNIKKYGMKAGISIKPATDAKKILPIIESNCGIDLILIMSVEPGFGGQSFIPSVLEKVRFLRQKYTKTQFLIEIDGGITNDNVQLVADAGVDVVVAGSFIFKHEIGIQEAIQSLCIKK